MDNSSDHETQASKKRKVAQKTVVAVKMSEQGKQKSEGPPSDSWSWRKYGQKPIKGSPYPRGYYRCSTSKGCSAKKQVERCKTDSSMLIITYTFTHNHPDPKTRTHDPDPVKPASPKQEPEELEQKSMSNNEGASENNFHYSQTPFNSSLDMIIGTNDEEKKNPFNVVFDEEPLSYPHLMTFSSSAKSQEDDFFDELEELPISSYTSLTSFMMCNFLEDRILLHPSWNLDLSGLIK